MHDPDLRRPDPTAADPAGITPPEPGPVPAPGQTLEPGRFTPEPEPRPEWASPTPAPEPVAWGVPATAARTATVEARPPRAGSAVGTVLAASLISAVLASGGTFLALQASGALDREAAAPTVPTANPASTTQPVTIDESSAVIDVAAKVGPAVVKITAEGVTSDPFSIPETGVGSGVIYDSDGWILTNRHVVADSESLTVELADGTEYAGSVYGIDTLTDLAIVKIDATGLPIAALADSDRLEVGQLTVAIGSPLGTYSNTVTAGILSATGRSIQTEGEQLNNLLQTDTAINPGNSGGPLLDSGGNVIGINTAIASSAEGIGFAIPINLAKPIMEQAVAGEELARPYIGVRFKTIDVQLAAEEDLPVEDGALIDDAQGANGQILPAVVPGSPADEAGLQRGDIVTGIEGTTLDHEHPLDAVVSGFAPGDTVTMDVLRGDQRLSIDVTLGTRPSEF
jgi:S1-C subfamily serine protease